MEENILFKEGYEKELRAEFEKIDLRLKMILDDMAFWITHVKKLKFVITDLLSEELEDKKLSRVSKSHQEGRAADIRVRDWPLSIRKEFEDYFELKYKKWAAISASTNKRNLIVIHDNGNGIHCHIQVSKKEG